MYVKAVLGLQLTLDDGIRDDTILRVTELASP